MNKNLSDGEERAGNPERVNNMGQSPALCKGMCWWGIVRSSVRLDKRGWGGAGWQEMMLVQSGGARLLSTW